MAGDTVFLDMNQNGTLDSSTANPASTDVPLSMPDAGTFNSTLTTSGLAGLVTDVTVTLNMTWPWDSDLTAYLISPAGTSVELFANVGGSGQNFTGTTFSDQAGTSIATAAAPFTGTFQPQGVLGTLDGGQPNGTWTLQINNDWNTDSGKLNSWSLSIASAEPSGDRRERQLSDP